MLKLVVDEDLPRSLARVLRDQGFAVLEVRESGLRGRADQEVFEFAQKERAAIITADLDFGNVLRFRLGSHYGIVIVHFPNEISTTELNRQFSRQFAELSEKDFKGNLIILEPGKIRIRRD